MKMDNFPEWAKVNGISASSFLLSNFWARAHIDPPLEGRILLYTYCNSFWLRNYAKIPLLMRNFTIFGQNLQNRDQNMVTKWIFIGPMLSILMSLESCESQNVLEPWR